MAKKKKQIEEIITEETVPEMETVEVEEAEEEIESEIPTSTFSYNYAFKAGDRVLTMDLGNASPDGTGNPVKKARGIKWVKEVIGGATNPFLIVNENDTVIGYFKEKALSKI